ncbi:MAG: cell division protein FtsA, partial [Anaerolineales bacterium]
MDEPLLTAVDVGTSKVCTLVAELIDEDLFEIIGVGIVPAAGIRKGMIVDVEQASSCIQAAIRLAERSSGYQIGAAFVSLAGAHISSVNSHGVVGISGHRGIDEDDVDRALDAAQAIAIPHNREVMHIIPRGFAVDGQDGVRSPLGMHGFRLEVEAHIVTAAKTSVQNLTNCVENSGVGVEQLVLNPLAAAEVALKETEREMGVVVCDIGGGTTDLAIFIEGNVWHTMVLSVGGSHITSDIAHGLRLPIEIAEGVKKEHGHAWHRNVDASEHVNVRPFGSDAPIQISRAELAHIVEARVEEIFMLVLQEIKRSGYDGLLPAGLVLTGGTARLPGIRAVAGDVLGLPVRVAEPEDLHGLVDQVHGPEFATSVGLLNWAVRETLFGEPPGTNNHRNG